MKNKLLPLLFVLGGYSAYSQVVIGKQDVTPSAQLEVFSKDKGFLIPQIELRSSTDRTTIKNGNVNSLLVFNTKTIADVQPGYYYWYVDKWCRIALSDEIGTEGKTISNTVINPAGNLIINFSDGTTLDLGKVKGDQGSQGLPGKNGEDGKSITSTEVNASGNLIITYNDGSISDAGEVKGTQGDKGETGSNGTDGLKGDKGESGSNGTDGVGGKSLAGKNITITGEGTVDEPYIVNSETTHFLSSLGNIMTSDVNGLIATSPIVNTVVTELDGTNLKTTVNGVLGRVDLKDIVENSTTNNITNPDNTITTTVNGKTASAQAVNTVVTELDGTNLKTTVNGVLGRVDLKDIVENSTTNNITNPDNTITTTVNGKTASAQAVNTVVTELDGTNLKTTVNGVLGRVDLKDIVENSTTNNITNPDNTITTTVNGKKASAQAVNTVVTELDGTNLKTTVNGVLGRVDLKDVVDISLQKFDIVSNSPSLKITGTGKILDAGLTLSIDKKKLISTTSDTVLEIKNGDGAVLVDAEVNIVPAVSNPAILITNKDSKVTWLSDFPWLLNGNANGIEKTIGTKDSFDFPFITNNKEWMRLKTNGRLGLGTLAPLGGIHLKSADGVGNDVVLEGISDNSALQLYLTPTGSNGVTKGERLGQLTFGYSNNNGASFLKSSNIIANYKGSDNGASNLSDMQFYTSNISRGVIDENGFLGLGNLAPKNVLHVTATTNPLRLEGLQTGVVTDQLLTVDANGIVRKVTNNNWNTFGNSGTTGATNFIGTTDNVDLNFKRNNIQAGKLSTNTTALGVNALVSLTSGNNNTGFGVASLQTMTTGSNNVSIGYQSGMYVGNGLTTLKGAENSVFIGYDAKANSDNETNQVVIGYNAKGKGSNTVQIGNSSMTNIGGAVNWSIGSDVRLKKDIITSTYGLNFINKLRPVTYKMKIGTTDLQSGFIAQEVESAAYSIGYEFNGIVKPQSESDFYSLRYSEFVVPLVKAVQEQQLQIETLQKELNDLKASVKKLIDKN